MTTLYNIKNKNILDALLYKKIFSLNYLKFIVRDTENNKTITTDNFYNSTIYTSKNIIKVATVLNINKYIFSSKYIKHLKFIWLNKNNKIKFLLEEKCNNTLLKNSSLLLLSPTKSGLESYSCGIKGVIPTSNFKFMQRVIILNNEQFCIFKFISSYSKNANSSKFNILKIPIELGKVNIFSSIIKNKFSKSKNLRKLHNNMKFIFIYKNNNKQFNENNKITQKSRKYYFKKRSD